MHLALLAVFSTYFMQESTCASPPTSLKGIGKILGGKPSKMGEYPFILSLEDNGSQFCGASAIGDYWALTAAHCVDVSARVSETYELRAGTLTKGINGTVHHVTKVIVHHGYNYRQIDNDIALIQVAEPFSKNKYVKYVRLPDQGEITPVGTKAWVAGWGLTKPGRKCVETSSFCSHFSSQRSREARLSRLIYRAELFVNVLKASPHLGHRLV
uniref:Peptidase S1 domain-containing protein n=1 Tax=Timema bartmani TaxID=61472 RepID=A0A7R9ETK0_9NEOP|nr:unnamed protein product [Timema bartmani]